MTSKRLALLIAGVVAIGAPAGAQQRGAQQAAPPQAPAEEFLLSTGSGFLLTSSGYIATNYHVVRDATKIEVRIPGRQALVPGTVIVVDQANDLAIVKAQGTGFGNTPISFADEAQVKVGQDATVLGYPLGDIMGATVRLATGTVSSLFGIQDDPRVYQISNPIQPGNSGGPVFNRDGQLFGIVVSGLNAQVFLVTQGIVPQNVNFAVKSNLLKSLVQKVPDAAEALRRTTKVAGTREQQVAALSPFVVQIVNYRAAISTAANEFRKAPNATMRVDLLGGRMALFVDATKWKEAVPENKDDSQQFVMVKEEAQANVFIDQERTESSIDQMKAGVLKRLQGNLPDAQIVSQERRTVNGLPLLTARIDATSASGPVALLAQFYTSAEGSVQMVGLTDRRVFDKFKPEFDELLSGLLKPTDAQVKGSPWLTEWTRRTLRRLDSPLLMRVFAREPEFTRYQGMLTPFQDAGKAVFVEYVDPEKSPEVAKLSGVTKPGAIDFEYKGRSLVMTNVEKEVGVTQALIRLITGPQKIYFTQVHAERDLGSTEPNGYASIAAWLGSQNFVVERLVPTTDNKIPADASIVVAAGPKRDFTANQIASLKQYLAAGGRVLLLVDPQSERGGGPMPNLTALAKEWNIELGEKVMAKAGSAAKFIRTEGLGAASTAKPTVAAPPNPNVVVESRFAVIGDADFAANAGITTIENLELLVFVLDWLSEPIPPADPSK